jgi:MFS family permease
MATEKLTSAVPLPAAAVPASRVRYGVLAFLCTLTFILYLDRICINQAASHIQDDLKIDEVDMSWIFNAFILSYCFFEVPTGNWGDRYGSRGVLTRVVLWWSAFTALTGAVGMFWVLLVVRFLFGAGEAGAIPNSARISARWFPPASRGSVQGYIITAALVGGAVANPVAAHLIEWIGWRWAFAVFGAMGPVWAVAFYRWFRDDPAEHPAVNEAELHLIKAVPEAPADAHPPIPWRLVLSSANVWLLGSVMACGSFTTYLYFTWYSTYLKKARDLSEIESGRLAGLVLWGGVVGCLLGGWLHDRVLRWTGDRRWTRSGIGASVFTLAALAVLASIHCDSAVASSLCMSVACLGLHAHAASWWGVTTDITGKHLAALFGLMNSMGIPGAFSSPYFLGWFVRWRGEHDYTGREQWDPAFYVNVVVLLIGAVCWLLVDARKSVVEPRKEEG